MRTRSARPLSVLLVAVLGLSAVVAYAAMAMYLGAPLAPMPGERILSRAEVAEALAGMRPAEREAFATLLDDPSTFLPVAYTRREYAIVEVGDELATLSPVGTLDPAAGQLDVPRYLLAGSATKPGTNLYISIAVARMACSGCYEWRLQSYFDWSGTTGMDCCNGVEDSVGVSWAGDLWLARDSWYGQWANRGGQQLPIYRSDQTPNEGVGWSFREFYYSNLPSQYADYATMYAYIRETSWRGTTSNAAMKYVHTKSGGGIGLSFFNGTISVSGDTNPTWSLAAYASFSH